MNAQPFDWFEDTMEVESSEFQQKEAKRGVLEQCFDISVATYKYLAAFTAIVWIFRYIINARRYEVGSIGVDTILLSSFVYFGSLCVITNVLLFFTFLSKKLGTAIIKKKIMSSYRLMALTIWFLFNLYTLPYVKSDMPDYYKIVKAYLQSGLLTSITFVCVNLLMDYLGDFFIEKSLFAKMNDVEMSERILAAMKNYRYELAESSSSSTSQECSLRDLLWFGNESEEENEEHIELRKWDQKRVGSLNLKPPEIQSLYDAKTLSRDVFEKAAEGGDILNFDHFARIFPNDQIALQSLPFFETNGDQQISKKEFKDTIINFYVDRVNLEKSFNIAKGFVNIIGDIIRIGVFGFLILAYLVLFGIPLKELVALALSSALLLNFLVSGAASELYFNLMFLLSHPFDVGDDVIIDGKDYRIYKIGLTCTSLVMANGGKVKLLNSVLWKMSIVNMTRAPEKLIAFNFNLDPSLDIVKFQLLKAKIQKYLRERPYDYYETFSFEAQSEASTAVTKLECNLILRCKTYKNKSKKFDLRVEVTNLIQELFHLLDIKQL